MRKTIFLVLLVMALGLLPVAGQATIYTDETAFLNALLPGSYTENFSGLPAGLQPDSMNFSGGGFSYTLSAVAGLFAFPSATPPALSTNNENTTIQGLNFASTGDPLVGIGGFFYLTDIDGDFVPGALSVTINGVATLVDSVLAPAFFGVIDFAGISSLEVAPLANWATISNLTVGAATAPVPVPPSVLLLGSGLLGLVSFRKKFAK